MYPVNCLMSLCALLSVFSAVQSFPATTLEPALLEKLRGIPQGWKQGRAPGPGERLRFRIAIKQENAFEFEQHLLAISDPENPSYGQHMKRDDLKAMLRPSEDATSSVIAWLQSEGVPLEHIQDDGDWINFYISRTEADRILGTKFYYYYNKMADVERIRTLQYSVPRNLHRHIHMIQPTTRFGQLRPQRSTVYEHFEIGPSSQDTTRYPGSDLNVQFCNTTITPQCLRDLYHIGNFTAKHSNGRLRSHSETDFC